MFTQKQSTLKNSKLSASHRMMQHCIEVFRIFVVKTSTEKITVGDTLICQHLRSFLRWWSRSESRPWMGLTCAVEEEACVLQLGVLTLQPVHQPVHGTQLFFKAWLEDRAAGSSNNRRLRRAMR